MPEELIKLPEIDAREFFLPDNNAMDSILIQVREHCEKIVDDP